MEGVKKIWSLVSKIRIRNWKIVILCIVTATIFKLFNALNKDYTTSIRYPVNFIFDPSGVVVMEDLPEDIQINVSGGGWNLFRKTFAFNIPPLQIKLEKPSEVKRIVGATLVPVITDQIKDFQLNYVVTDTLFIKIDEKASKVVGVAIDSTVIDLEDNHFIVSNVVLKPDSVTVIGPESVLKQMEGAIQLGLPYRAIDENFSEMVAIPLPNQRLMNKVPERVRVSFEVAEFTAKTKQVPITKVNFPSDSSAYLSDSTVQVNFLIRKVADNTETEGFELVADFSLINKEDSTILPMMVHYPDQASQLSMDSTRLKVIYAK